MRGNEIKYRDTEGDGVCREKKWRRTKEEGTDFIVLTVVNDGRDIGGRGDGRPAGGNMI